jgi:hypothetical protein
MAALSALIFWGRHQVTFWLMALPIASLAAAVAYVLDTQREFIGWRHHWGWDFLFAIIYAMFLDRWIKEALLEDATPCDEVDEMRRSAIAVRFLTFAAALCLLAIMVTPCPYVELNAVACAAAASVFVMLLPALAAHRPITLSEAFHLGRPVQSQLFLLIGGAILVSLMAGLGLSLAATLLPAKPWAVAAVAAVQRVVDCLLMAGVGYGLATIFRSLTDWQQPEPADRPFHGMRLRARKV